MPRSINVLIAEDNPADAELVLRQMRHDGFDPSWVRVDSEADFVANLNADVELVLSDFAMPQFNGLRALELLKKTKLDIPFILVSGTIGEDIAVSAMKAGAIDYLLKDRLGRLGQAINNGLDQSRLRQERRRGVEELRLFRTLVDQSTDTIEVVDPETARYIDVNMNGFACLGYSRAEFLSLRVFDVNLTIKEAGWPKLVAALRANGFLQGEGIHRRKDGTTFLVEFNVRLVKLDRDYLVANVRDITERKELEANSLRAQRLDAIGTLTSGIAHDMNNILAPIMMSAPLLRMGLSAEKREQTLVAIEASAQRGADLVRQLLAFARGVEGPRRTIQAGVLIREMVKIARQTFPKTITIVESVPKGNWPIVGDTTQLHQVLLNLCVNARDAMPDGGVLTIAAENIQIDLKTDKMPSEAKTGPYVLLSVTDTGTGISQEIVDRIFIPFFTTKESGKGTGLGLSTVVGIVKSHGGFISLKSVVGKGSSFQVFLPANPEGIDVVVAKSPADAVPGHGELILVVDDEVSILEVVRNILVRYGYRVIIAHDGVEASKQYVLHRKEIHAVITDLDMPLMGGLALVRALKATDPSVAILVSSGLASERRMKTRRAELDALGVKKMLSKPYTVEMILKAIRDVLSERQLSANPAPPQSSHRTRDVNIPTHSLS
jgi:two-component system cell cycle sensor histidine kinase/response regulator CckA